MNFTGEHQTAILEQNFSISNGKAISLLINVVNLNWVWSLVSQTEGDTQAEVVWE